MRQLLFAAVIGSLFVAYAAADKPPDTPCVTWTLWNSNEPINNLNRWYIADYVNMVYDPEEGCAYCEGQGYVIPCFAPSTNTWGHHDYVPGDYPTDYCRTNVNGTVIYANNFYMPAKGDAVRTWSWQLTQSGAKVPDNAIRFGPSVMARSNANYPGCCMGQGFTGWAIGKDDGTFGDVFFAIAKWPVTEQDFSVAICKAYKPTPAPPTPAPPTPVPPTGAPPTPAPPTPVPTTAAPPTLPPNNRPYIRFAHALPSTNNIDATIVQGNVSYTWTNYKFGQFSSWVEVFSNGHGLITLWQNLDGKRVEPALLVNHQIPLTPGPLVVAVKADLVPAGASWWPPVNGTNVETIAASYDPAVYDSGARLFNLSPDTMSADLYSGGSELVSGVQFTLGSAWAPVPVQEAEFTVNDHMSNKTLASVSFTPPDAPFVFTIFLVGSQNHSGTSIGPTLVPLVDAPEQ